MSRAQLTSTVEQNTGGAVAPFVAGKNAIINGDFYVNQRGFTSTTSSGYVLFDRFSNYVADGTVTYSNQTFTAGAAPVSGYEGKSFIQSAVSGQTAAGAASFFSQKIENVRTLAGQTATLSFWAKAASGTPKIAFEYTQSFGTGGSPSSSVSTVPIGTVTLTTSWARYSINIAIPSLSGKTIGTTDGTSYLEIGFWLSAGSSFASRASSIGIQNNTIGVWGVQLEAGSVATPFTTATGTVQGELAACMRYAEKLDFTSGVVLTVGQAYSTSAAWGGIAWTTQKRTTPTITQTGTIQALQANTATSGTTFAYGIIGINNARMEHSGGSGLIAGNAVIFQAVAGAASLLITAEL